MQLVVFPLTLVSPESATAGVGRWCTSAGCITPEIVAHLLVAVGVGALTLFALFTLSSITSARELCVEETERTEAERAAFERFSRQVAAVDPSPATSASSSRASTPLASSPKSSSTGTSSPGTASLTASAADDRQLDQVRAAYRETVMAVPHYDEEYDESLAVNVAAEFGDEVAVGLADGPVLTPQLKGALADGARTARAERRAFLQTLERERTALDDAEARIETVESALTEMNTAPLTGHSFDDLRAVWERLGDIERDVVRLVTERQQVLQDGSFAGPGRDCFELHDYLYQPVSFTHPVLGDATTTLGRTRTARRRVLRALTARA